MTIIYDFDTSCRVSPPKEDRVAETSQKPKPGSLHPTRQKSPDRLENVGQIPSKYEHLAGLPVFYTDSNGASRCGYIYKIVGNKVSLVVGYDERHVTVDKEQIKCHYDKKTKEKTPIQW